MSSPAPGHSNPYETLAALVTVAALLSWLFDWPWMLPFGILLGLAGLLFRSAAQLIHRGWMAIVRVLNFVFTHVLLSLVFLLVLTPIAWMYRRSRSQRTPTNGDSHFMIHEHDYRPEDLEKPW